MICEKEVKIYLPEVSESDRLFFHGSVTEDSNCHKFFITRYTDKYDPAEKSSLLGVLIRSDKMVQDCNMGESVPNFVMILRNEANEITQIDTKIAAKSFQASNYLLIQYNLDKFYQLSKNTIERAEVLVENDFIFLAKLIQSDHKPSKFSRGLKKFKSLFYSSFIFLCNIFSILFRPFYILFNNTAVCKHFMYWKKKLNDRDSDGSILFDVLMGIVVFALLSYIHVPGKYFMSLTEQIVYKLRDLLEMLKGSPVGLKLNVQLNNFLLDCFMYHVDLWWNFIIIVKPTIHYMFFPITIMGLFGLSFQCAMLCDLLILITLHAHCFYIYAALLYKIELSGIQSLFRIVLGRRKNVLRDRLESQEYTNRQLYVATLFFTILLFLLPTIIVYYVVFASLRFLIYCPTYLLMTVQRRILMFRFNTYIRWLFGTYVNLSNMEMKFISSKILNNSNLVSVHIEPNSAKPWKRDVFERKSKSMIPRPVSLTKFLGCLISGKLMAFSKLNNDEDQKL